MAERVGILQKKKGWIEKRLRPELLWTKIHEMNRYCWSYSPGHVFHKTLGGTSNMLF